ncbi:MAG: sensor histidine kinase [Verrucomicrobiia bacterium]
MARPSRAVPAAVFLVLAALVLATGYGYHRNQCRILQNEAAVQLAAIAELKINQIVGWRRERMEDGLVAARTPLEVEAIARYLRSPSPVLEKPIRHWLGAMASRYDYRAVLLLDASGRPRLATGLDGMQLPAEASAEAIRVLRKGEVALSEFHSSREIPVPHLNLYVPLQGAGALVCRVDPQRFLYPLIQGWPVPSRTAETLLIRQEGKDVLYLNELRHRKGTAMTLRFPVNEPNLPSAMAVRGEEGTVEGKDYRGTVVLASIRRVPGSPWFLVAKVDVEEIYAPLRMETAWAFLATSGLVVIIGLSLVLWWKRQAGKMVRTLNVELERRVTERTAQLADANKELETFAYSVSHDLRTPLRGIDGFSKVLLEDCAGQLDTTAREHLGRIRAASQRMGLLIDDLLKLSRVSRMEMHLGRVDLSVLAREVAEELGHGEAARVVEWRITPGLVARADPGLARILLENLLGNAWKFTARHPKARIEFGVRPHGGGDGIGSPSVFFVRDDGAGFDMTYADKLFAPFQRLHATWEFEGTGIGLANVQRIVHRHGGRAWAEGVVEQGATFFFTLSNEP